MTTATTTAERVARSLDGDLAAFSALIAQHQGAAYGYALAQLRDAAAAQDAVQDALVDAYLNLGQLREPSAFAGWLRRIVFKHCDRRRRRRRPLALASPPEPTTDQASTPEAHLTDAQQRLGLLDAIETLPDHERFVVALHYLAGQPVKEIAAFLSLSVSAVKKRLFSARNRLRQEQPMIESTRPDTIPQLEERIGLFLAIRSGDRAAVRSILRRRPDLLEAEERWSDEEALAGGFTLAHHLTPLILAAGYGDEAMVELLVELGASPAGRCGCDGGESALWAASRAGHGTIAERLLRAGASPDEVNDKGYRPADLTAWRRRSHPSAANLDGEAISTGIKALDLWVPLERGAVVRVYGAAETGLTVLLAEIAGALGRAGGKVVWTSWEPRPWQRRELEVLAARNGVDDLVEIVTSARAEERGRVAERGLERCRTLLEDHPFVAHLIFEQEGRASDLEAAFPALGEAASVTFVVRPWAAVSRGRVAVEDGPHDATLCTDPRLAARGLFPAIDPCRSRSRFSESAEDLREQARAVFEAYARLDPSLELEQSDDPTAQRRIRRARRLIAYLTQPFACAEPDTGWPGVAVPKDQTLRDVARILDGELDDEPEEALRYRGAL